MIVQLLVCLSACLKVWLIGWIGWLVEYVVGLFGFLGVGSMVVNWLVGLLNCLCVLFGLVV